jgi:hypothetical protein
MIKHKWGTQYWMIKRSGGVVYSPHCAQGDDELEFLGLTSKPRSTVSPALASKPVLWVSWFEPQNRQLQCDDLCLKITAIVLWFEFQNQADYDLSIVS